MRYIFILLFTSIALLSCKHNKTIVNGVEIQNGDLLFQQSINSDLEKAINKVTSDTNTGYGFTHVGIVWIHNDTVSVIEAAPPKVRISPLKQYLEGDNPNDYIITIPARLRPQYRHLIDVAIDSAKKYLGKDYDYEYLLDNDKYYCSELIHIMFKEANNNIPIFTETPMTFKYYEPEKDSLIFSPLWIEHYNKLNMAIPEGMPGLVPTKMAYSDIVDILVR